MTMYLKNAAVCAAMLTLASTSLYAEESGPSRPFFAQMVLQGVTFQVESPNDSSINPVTVRALVDGKAFAEEGAEADGTITGVEVEDLNADGYPEVYVYVTSAGSGSYGSLIAYASNRNRSISPISLPPLEDDAGAAKGYMGHDRFVVGEGSLVRNFPIYKDGDTNAAPTGGTRQIQYRLQAGEAGWRLVPDKVFDF
jgi:Periplasmic lysozyme inhibitor of I-type lysozyme